MKNYVIKYLYEQIENLGIDDIREAVQNIIDSNDDFEIENYRFISDDKIDDIMVDELSSDEYTLGCFNADFLSDIIDIDSDVIKAMQKAEAFEAIGKLVLSLDKIHELQSEYAKIGSYGHHFAHYDHHDTEIFVGNNVYHAFKIN